MTDPTPPVHPSGTRNPGPRPALQRRTDDDTVISARPRPGTAPATTATLAAPAPAAVGADAELRTKKDKDRKDKDKKELKAGRDDRASKDGKKHKDHTKSGKSGKHHKDHHDGAAGEGPVRDDRELTIVLPKAVRRALGDAAAAHGTTPERLVALVLNEWLDH